MPNQVAPNVLSWATDIEQNTIDQAANTAKMPFLTGHLSLMPDAHLGMGSTVGSVFATQGAVIPSCIGVDIGCGMLAAKFNLTAEDLPDDLDPLLSRIGQYVPAGVNQGNKTALAAASSFLVDAGTPELMDTNKGITKILHQYGSLGSGNHFVELCLDENDDVWVVLHSGSRGAGNILAKKHIDIAKGLMKRYFIDLPDPDLAYVVQGTPEFDNYIKDMLWAQSYAKENRGAMFTSVWKAIQETITPSAYATEIINCHHNFTQMESINDKNVWVTRKGAIQARVGDLGIIPGSMGTETFIVEGKGNPSAYNSCSHGAGRRMGRKEAKRQFSKEDLEKAMEGKTWNSDHADKLVDEIPSSYKDINEVMAAQKDLVSIKHTLKQILNFKGI